MCEMMVSFLCILIVVIMMLVVFILSKVPIYNHCQMHRTVAISQHTENELFYDCVMSVYMVVLNLDGSNSQGELYKPRELRRCAFTVDLILADMYVCVFVTDLLGSDLGSTEAAASTGV